MPNTIQFYSDSQCTKAGQVIAAGIAAATGNIGNPENWHIMSWNHTSFSRGNLLYLYARDIARIGGALTLSGGAAIYDCSVPQTMPFTNTVLTDTVSNTSQNIVYNPYFISFDSENECSYAISIYCNIGSESQQQYRCYNFNLWYYTQSPIDAKMSNRNTWNYTFDTTMGMQDLLYMYHYESQWPSNMRQIKLYKLAMGENDYYLLAFGVSADGQYNTDASLSAGTVFIAIPVAYFKDKEPRPWAGNETESNSDTSYMPSTPYRGSVLPRDLTDKRNPYGFNAGNGLSLAILEYTEYAAILQGIYAGTAESVLNKISQQFAQIVGGNTHRPVDEVTAITRAILCCHMVPQITGYVSGSITLKTIAGYHILGGNGDSAVQMSIWKTDNTIFQVDTSTYYITRRLNSFLDFEPYTSIQLHLPFMPVVDIKPSILYGNGLYLHYTIDIYTGVLSCDVMIVDNNSNPNRTFVLTTVQTNVKTEIPVMGNAAQNSAFGSISSAIIGAMGGKDDSAVIASGIQAADALSAMSTGNAVGKTSVDGIGAYLSNRQPYLIITRPNPANPSNYAELNGFTSNMGGVVGDFTGYSVFESVDLSGIAATESEKQEIESLLKGGCFV